jgi:hypothetical protein
VVRLDLNQATRLPNTELASIHGVLAASLASRLKETNTAAQPAPLCAFAARQLATRQPVQFVVKTKVPFTSTIHSSACLCSGQRLLATDGRLSGPTTRLRT